MFDASQHFGATLFPSGNNTKRVFCAVVLDRSGSMNGPAIDSLNAGMQAFARELTADNVARDAVDLAVISFSDDVTIDTDWTQPDLFVPKPLIPDSSTNMGAGLQMALSMIDARKDAARAQRKPSYVPWLVLITDGEPSDTELADQMALECCERAKQQKLVVWPIGVQGANMTWLSKVGANVQKLDGLAFTNLFRFISASLASRASVPENQAVPLPRPQNTFVV